MHILEYKDFNEAYYHTNRLLALEPDTIDYRDGMRGLVRDLIITTKSTKCDKIDLGQAGYKNQKWNHLISSYLGDEKIEELRNFKTKRLTRSFDFKRKKDGEGGCILSIVFSRTKSGKAPWTKANILWKTTDLARAWAGDLILIHRILELVPNTDIKEITMIFTSAYQSTMYVIPLLELVFDITEDMLDPDVGHSKMILTKIGRAHV